MKLRQVDNPVSIGSVLAVVLASAFTEQGPGLAGLACGGSNQDWLSALCAARVAGTETVVFAGKRPGPVFRDAIRAYRLERIQP